MKRIITIQDISCVGKCSLTVALPVISAMGVEACVLPTAVLSTHVRKAGDELGVEAVVGQRHGNVGLAAAEGGVELPGLAEAQITGRGKPEHDLSESNDSGHG